MKTFKAFIKLSEARKRSVKRKIYVNFLCSSEIGTERVREQRIYVGNYLAEIVPVASIHAINYKQGYNNLANSRLVLDSMRNIFQ